MAVVKCAWLDNPPSAKGDFPDGGLNTETLLQKHLDSTFKGSKPIFVIIRHQASKSTTYYRGPSSFRRPAGQLFRITLTAYTTDDDNYDGAPVEVKAGHAWVPDRHAERLANDEEMDEYRVECKEANPTDDGPPGPVELLNKESTDEEFLQVTALVRTIMSRYETKPKGSKNPFT